MRSVGTAKDFKYEESARRATYTGDAHLSGPQGDMTADKIELYLKPSGDELDRAEAYEKLTLREQNRKTTGARMTYTTANETYVVTGLPVAIVDECGRETKGRKLTFVKATDTVVVDGGGQVRTQTKSAGKCLVRAQMSTLHTEALTKSTADARSCGTSTSTWRRAKSSACSDPTVPARRRRST